MTDAGPRDGAAAFAAGQVFARAGRWEEARVAFMEAARLAPAASLAWLSLSLVLFELNAYDDAARAIGWALRAVPILDTPEMREGVGHFEANRWAEGQLAFEAALARGVRDSPPHLLLSLCLLRQGRTEEAQIHLRTGYDLEDLGSQPR